MIYQVLILLDLYTGRSILFRSLFLQELKEKQKELESKAKLFSRLAGEKSSAKPEPVFKNNIAPLQRKPSTATKTNKQQAVVQPLQGRSETTRKTVV